MRLKDLLTPLVRLLGRAAKDTAQKTVRDLASPAPKRRAAGSDAKAARDAVKKARQAARVTRRRG